MLFVPGLPSGCSIENLEICSPKRNPRLQTGWEGFFPYYAGYPESFARALLESAKLKAGDVVLDPWNGSGTTTYTAAHLGLKSLGFDLNPVMVIVARARLLAASEADSIEPLALHVAKYARVGRKELDVTDPLTWWFAPETAAMIRGIERSIRRRMVGRMTMAPAGTKLDRLSCIAATFYVALFSACRELVDQFQSSNPTWLRRPKETEAKVEAPRELVTKRLVENLRSMAAALVEKAAQPGLFRKEEGKCEIRLADTSSATIPAGSVDLILTSPPYCTRIDYTAATRIELAILAPLLQVSEKDLARQMIGSTRVPLDEITPSPGWGDTCTRFLEVLSKHPSKASAGYYYRTHLDYFDKMSRSLSNLVMGLKQGSAAILVVQDSHYKDLHNDLPAIIGEMAEAKGLVLARAPGFPHRSMSDINPRARKYRRPRGAVEKVLCFYKR